MDPTIKRTAQTTAVVLLLLAVTQALYTVLYMAKLNVPRHLLWGIEGLLFTLLAAFAGAALAQAKHYHVAWSAIAFSAVLNVVQVSVGLTMFGAFREAAGQVDGLAPAAGGVVAFSFMVYYAAKLLLGLAAFIIGWAKFEAAAKVLGGLTALAGGVAMLSNATVVVLGRDSFMPSAVAGGSGVVATLLLALCLLNLLSDD